MSSSSWISSQHFSQFHLASGEVSFLAERLLLLVSLVSLVVSFLRERFPPTAVLSSSVLLWNLQLRQFQAPPSKARPWQPIRRQPLQRTQTKPTFQSAKCAFQFKAGTNIAPRKTCFLHIMRKKKEGQGLLLCPRNILGNFDTFCNMNKFPCFLWRGYNLTK